MSITPRNVLSTLEIKGTVVEEVNTFTVFRLVGVDVSTGAWIQADLDTGQRAEGILLYADPTLYVVATERGQVIRWGGHGFTPGDTLWLSSTGQMQNTRTGSQKFHQVVAQVLDDDHLLMFPTSWHEDDIYLDTGRMQPHTGMTSTNINNAFVHTMPNTGADVLLRFSAKCRASWEPGGLVGLRIHYAMSASGQNCIASVTNRMMLPGTSALGVTGNFSEANFTIPSSGAANREEEHTLTNTTAVVAARRRMQWLLTRHSGHGSDGTADLYITGLTITYTPP